MTAPNGNILFNSSTGSDTAASGLGPVTAISGTGADLDATSTVDLSADSPDLSGVTAGDLLWVDTSSGRQFSIIASVDDGADTVTCDDAFDVTESGRNWGIGGKRATYSSSSEIFDDVQDDWTIEQEDDQSISATIALAAVTARIIGTSGAVRKITQTSNLACISLSTATLYVTNIKLENSNGTKTIAYGIRAIGGGSYANVKDCVIGDETNQLLNGLYRTSGTARFNLANTLVTNCTSHGVALSSQNSNTLRANRSRFVNNGGSGIYGGSSFGDLRLYYCIMADNTERGVYLFNVGSPSIDIKKCKFVGNGDDGMEKTDAGTAATEVNIVFNEFVDNGGYGFSFGSYNEYDVVEIDYNAYYNNSSGEVENITNGDNDITLTADPYVDSANGDYNLNNTSGGGATLLATTVTLP